jgi:hypothetical protein
MVPGFLHTGSQVGNQPARFSACCCHGLLLQRVGKTVEVAKNIWLKLLKTYAFNLYITEIHIPFAIPSNFQN